VIGHTYLLRGVPVVVLARWGRACPLRPDEAPAITEDNRRNAPRNVLVEFPGARMLAVDITSGARVVRPFRGLRVER
jgi:hypothetical protein